MFRVSDAFSPAIQQNRNLLWEWINSVLYADEDLYVQQLVDVAESDGTTATQMGKVTQKAIQIISHIRKSSSAMSLIDMLMQQYNLNTDEGILLMCLAEALIRVPDAKTAEAFIRDRISRADWSKYLQKSSSLLINASTWGLLISGKVMKKPYSAEPKTTWSNLTSRLGEPIVRKAMAQSMKILGNYFILGQTIDTALSSAKDYQKKGYCYSFDMLGEAAITATDAQMYKTAYSSAIEAIGLHNQKYADQPATISVKLSALHPRYETAQSHRVMTELYQTLLDLIRLGRKHGVGVTIDAEETERMELSLKLFEKTFIHQDCKGWGQFGVVIQAYGKRALPALVWLRKLAEDQQDKIPVRLVKGAYWDREIKHSQELGEAEYAVFTRKESTDLAYLTCVRFLLDETTNAYLFPQFASHNPHTIASILEMANDKSHFELQRLHGMGDALYAHILEEEKTAVRIYAPVGYHKDLLPYLVRRLLENGANSSFVHRLADAKMPVETLAEHPIQTLQKQIFFKNTHIPLPADIFPDRKNSSGVNITIEPQWQQLQKGVDKYMHNTWTFGPMINGEKLVEGELHKVVSPANTNDHVGDIFHADSQQTEQALTIATEAFPGWCTAPIEHRMTALNKLADLLEENRDELIALCHREAGKTVQDSIDEIREAVDFCRYYAREADNLFESLTMPGPTGENNKLSVQGRGVFLCISPWNFPLAIFLGQVAAALITGNTVLAKPAEQTMLIAAKTVELAWEAGIPGNVLQLLTGYGSVLGKQLLPDNRVCGVAFTGSTETAWLINRQLAARHGPIVPLIAETGGQNTMIVDSTALPEQVVTDVIRSTFTSAGQRCSALRVMYVQQDIAERVTELLKGVMEELVVGLPFKNSTDVGPIIDEKSASKLQEHIDKMEQEATLIARSKLSDDCNNGYFIAPVAFKLDHISQLEKENFGPILHVITFEAGKLDEVIDEINSTGFGLTAGIHSRNESTTEYIAKRINAGNIYINRNQIGAVVGVQPFGGMGLSGTGPKAGGPGYLNRFILEKHRSINTTAIGGNASLLVQGNS